MVALRPRSEARRTVTAVVAQAESKVPSHKLGRQAAQLRWESQPWEAWDSPVSYASLKTRLQPAALYVGNRKAPKRFREAAKNPYVLSTVEPSRSDGGWDLSDVKVEFEDGQGSESEGERITARDCIIEGAKLVDSAIRKKKRVLVHCYAGQNRSASICAAYLILYQGWTARNAIAHVRHRVNVAREVLEVVQNPCFAQILRRLKPREP